MIAVFSGVMSGLGSPNWHSLHSWSIHYKEGDEQFFSFFSFSFFEHRTGQDVVGWWLYRRF